MKITRVQGGLEVVEVVEVLRKKLKNLNQNENKTTPHLYLKITFMLGVAAVYHIITQTL